MRHWPSPAEARLWHALSGAKLGYTFRRQVVLGGRYIVDFLCRDARLIVEVDGAQHADRVLTDSKRDQLLARLGYRTLRVPAEQVHADLRGVVEQIRSRLG